MSQLAPRSLKPWQVATLPSPGTGDLPFTPVVLGLKQYIQLLNSILIELETVYRLFLDMGNGRV